MNVKGGWTASEGYASSFIYSEGDVVALVLDGSDESAIDRARLIAVAPEMEALLKQIMAAHRGQLPSECADLYGGGCGCSQCEQARTLLARIKGEL